MEQPRSIVISIDGLRASSLGCYGNSAIETPAFDRLSASGTTHDWCFSPSDNLEEVFESLWLESAKPARLVTDDPAVASFAEALGVATLVTESPLLQKVQNFGDTACAALLDNSASFLETDSPDRTIWVHHCGFFGPWDAPHEVACSLADEDDPEIPHCTQTPDFVVPADDVDEAIFIETCRYFAQLIAIDAALEGFLAWVANSDVWGSAHLTVCGTRGFSLGEHGYVGGRVPKPYGESFHVPCIRIAGQRSPRRSNTLQLLSTAIAGSSTANAPLTWRTERHCGVRTEGHLALFDVETRAGELFVKPDDRFESNDVATLCREELSQLASLARL